MAIAVPSTRPPLALQVRALPALISRLDVDHPDLDLLQVILSLLTRQEIQNGHVADVRPLQALRALQSDQKQWSGVKDVPNLLLDMIIAYPTHIEAMTPIIDSILSSCPSILDTIRTEILPELVTRIRLSDSTSDLAVSVRVILSLVRAHDELLGVLLSEADYVLPAFRDAYSKISRDESGLSVKSDMLVICHTLIQVMGASGGGEAMKRLMSDSAGSSKRPLVDGTLRSDYEAVFERLAGVQQEEIDVLKAAQEERARSDPRLTPLLNLFPDIPPTLLLGAVNHASFIPSTLSTYEEAAAPIIDAILSGGGTLPADLFELREFVQQAAPQVSAPEPPKVARDNIWNQESLDISRLKIKDENDPTLLQMGNTIPDHLRESIMRLVQSQEEEEEDLARALREAHGEPIGHHQVDDGEEETIRGIRVAEGEESDDESGDKVVSRRPSGSELYDVDQQTKLELAYLSDPKVFDRDSGTRKSAARKKLREITGMDDSQLEGWRIMLDRNPHKEAILSRHTFAPKNNYLGSTAASESGGGKGKGGGGRGGGGAGRGGGEGSGTRGGHGGGGSAGGGRGGGGRGRGSKGSRGHSNAARTRGHDKKMSRMGAGV